jgi:hypothetical protein
MAPVFALVAAENNRHAVAELGFAGLVAAVVADPSG